MVEGTFILCAYSAPMTAFRIMIPTMKVSYIIPSICTHLVRIQYTFYIYMLEKRSTPVKQNNICVSGRRVFSLITLNQPLALYMCINILK